MCKLFITCIDRQPMLNQDLKAGPPSIVLVEVLPHVNPRANLRYAIAKPHLDYHGHIVARARFLLIQSEPLPVTSHLHISNVIFLAVL